MASNSPLALFPLWLRGHSPRTLSKWYTQSWSWSCLWCSHPMWERCSSRSCTRMASAASSMRRISCPSIISCNWRRWREASGRRSITSSSWCGRWSWRWNPSSRRHSSTNYPHTWRKNCCCRWGSPDPYTFCSTCPSNPLWKSWFRWSFRKWPLMPIPASSSLNGRINSLATSITSNKVLPPWCRHGQVLPALPPGRKSDQSDQRAADDGGRLIHHGAELLGLL